VKPEAEVYRGTVVNMSAARTGGARTFELHLDGYTSDEELARLAALQKSKGADAVEHELYSRRLGFIRIGDALGYPVGLARQGETAQGRILYAVMDRPLQLYEIWEGTRSRDYPFSVVEIHIAPHGKLTGDLYPIARVHLLERGNMHIETDLPRPFRLLNLRKVK
jgi:hypothetical protein